MTVTDGRAKCAADGVMGDFMRLKSTTRQQKRSKNEVPWTRNALAHAPAKQRTAVGAMLKTIFAQETKAEAEAQWEIVADTLREK